MNINKFIYELSESQLDTLKYSKLNSFEKSYHEGKKDELHEVELFKIQLNPDPEVFLRWGFCKDCGEMRFKEVVGYDNLTNMAHVRKLTKKGKFYDNAATKKDETYEMAKTIFGLTENAVPLTQTS